VKSTWMSRERPLSCTYAERKPAHNKRPLTAHLLVFRLGVLLVRMRTVRGRAMVEQELNAIKNGDAANLEEEEARRAEGIAVIDLFAELFAQ
jgi:hypothetical protein